jgi:predicted RNA-binding protein YlqC (UPF0109 family)
MATERNKKSAQDDAVKGDEDLLRDIVSAFIRFPEEINIETERRGENSTMMKLEVHRDDYPRVFGGQGRHRQALVTIFAFIGAREERQIKFMLLESKKGVRQGNLPFKANLDWKPDKTLDLLRKILRRIFTKPFEVEALSAEETTNIEIRVDPSETNIIDALEPSLEPIFHAIGKNQGRQLYLEAPEPVPDMK